MSEVSFFDQVAAVGGDVLGQLGGRADAAPYLRRVRDVYELLAKIHDDLLSTTVEVGTAQTLDQGRHVLNAVHHDALESVFRARRWCDELEALGRDLQTLPTGVTIDDPATWEEFTETLHQREGEVAWLYQRAMINVINQADSATTLTELKEYMYTVSDELVTQKAKFDLIAKRAAAMARTV